MGCMIPPADPEIFSAMISNVRAQWRTNDNLEFELGYTHWFKGSYFDRLPDSAGLPPGGNTDSDYFYIQTKFRL